MPKSVLVRQGPPVALAVITVAAGLALALPLTWPDAWPHDAPPSAAVSEARAAAAADPVDLAEMTRQTRQTLAERPTDATAWARLAWIAAEQGDMAAAREALDRSYVAAPYGPEITAWRLRFAFNQWGRSTPDLRPQFLARLAETAAARPRLVEAARPDARDPAGRWALDMSVPPR